jgi:hypothetical protein
LNAFVFVHVESQESKELGKVPSFSTVKIGVDKKLKVPPITPSIFD